MNFNPILIGEVFAVFSDGRCKRVGLRLRFGDKSEKTIYLGTAGDADRLEIREVQSRCEREFVPALYKIVENNLTTLPMNCDDQSCTGALRE